MTLKKVYYILAIFACFFIAELNLEAQENEKGILIDEVVAVVGDKIIMHSDIETQYLQMQAQGIAANKDFKCQLFEELMFQKLLVNQAELDSIVVDEAQVESELERRMQYFIRQIGSREKLEEYYNKSISEIKEELSDVIQEQMVSEKMKNEITKDVKVTPSEVRNFFNSIHKDSIPVIQPELEIAHIVVDPPVSDEEVELVKAKLRKIRRRIQDGESFKTLAALYSEDKGSAAKGGELGFFSRGELYPEYESVAFSLEKGEMSELVKTKAGYHLIKLVERRGEQINTQHILMRPKVSTMQLLKAKNKLDSLSNVIKKGNVSFEDAALKHSDDPSKINGGLIINPMIGNTKFKLDDIDPSMYFVVSKMKVGDVSSPVVMETEGGNKAYRIFYLKSKTDEHKATLQNDYTYIKNLALQNKQEDVVKEWIENKKDNIHIIINDQFRNCNFQFNWNISNK